MKTLLFTLIFIATSANFGSSDLDIFRKKTALITDNYSFSETLVTVGRAFLGTPYVSHTLEGQSTEKLVVNLRQFDCLTFVENTVAICLASREKRAKPFGLEADSTLFLQKLQAIRYRNGQINGYGSRLHYFSEWLMQQEIAGNLRLISDELGGVRTHKNIAYMSSKRQLYAGLRDSTAFLMVKNAEKLLSSKPFFYIPKSKVAKIEQEIKEGDLVIFVSSKPDLDCTHEGFAVRENGRTYLLHASSEFGKVVVSKWPIADYLKRNAGQLGIMVARWTID